MKRLVSRKFSLGISALLACNVPLFALPMTSCSKKDTIQFANYESYMAPELMEDLQKNYSIQFPFYTVAEMIPAKFEKYYDVAVPCGYELMALLKRGWLEKIDWEKFNVTDMDGNKITNATLAKNLYIGEDEEYTGINDMNKQFTDYINEPGNEGMKKYLDEDGKFNILNYGVPYFAQSFMFAYTGDPIQFYKSGTTETTENPDWADIFYTVSKSNPNQDPRFKNKKIGMVDDARSLYDVGRIVESIESKEEKTTNDPTSDSSIPRMRETLNHITSKFKHNSFALNSDSQIVSKGLADRKGDNIAVMSWSGDTIYAAQGAEEYETFTDKNFHIVKPSKGSLDEIEFMVINNKNSKNTNKRNKIYEVIKQVGLDGCDKDTEEIVSSEGDNYKYWTMTNWDNILYTPMLKNIYKAVCDKENLSSYWTEQIKSEENPEGKYTRDTVVNLFIEILNGKLKVDLTPGAPETKHLFGKTLTNLQNSNNHWAWIEKRGEL